ncbi:fumarylacetoacetate hydrolase family protein [Paraburkholderia rhynchosiae]|nr:fumarylacetoacetate hydrolase family protein [Paraburkholderia rhynchosiae]
MLPVLINVSFAHCTPFPALSTETHALALAYWAPLGLRGTGCIETFLREWDANAALLKQISHDAATFDAIVEDGMPLSSFRMHAPVAPRQVYCTIGNYRRQLLEAALDAGDGPDGPGASARRAVLLDSIEPRRSDGAPYICLKGAVCVSGPNDRLSISRDLTTLDWEVEIGVVIGRSVAHVSAEDALHCIAGYCVVNDITLRERVFRQDVPAVGTDWLQSKSRPGWLPAGPWMVPAWNVADASQLRLWLRLNGSAMQDGVANDMIFSIGEQIAYLSSVTRLEPGDLICTGTPAGLGSHYGRYLRPGDLVEAGVEGLGSQRVLCVDE